MDQVVMPPIPKGYTFDYKQSVTFETPATYNARFFLRRKIPWSYIINTNQILRAVDSVCRKKCTTTTTTDEDMIQEAWHVNERGDILYLELTSTDEQIILKLIGVRPCFSGYKLLLVVLYILIWLARLTSKTLVLETCYATTIATVKRYFAEIVQQCDNNDENGTYVFQNQHGELQYVTPKYLGIEGLLREDENGAILLLSTQFPSEDQLNDQAFVDRHYGSKVLKPLC